MSQDKAEIVIKKVKGDGGGGHRGGARKVAYADFMTAMIAFFLLMWILATADQEQLNGLADYFAPSTSSANGPGGEGPLDGTTVGPDGTFNSSNSPLLTIATPNFGREDPVRPLEEVSLPARSLSLNISKAPALNRANCRVSLSRL